MVELNYLGQLCSNRFQQQYHHYHFTSVIW